MQHITRAARQRIAPMHAARPWQASSRDNNRPAEATALKKRPPPLQAKPVYSVQKLRRLST